MGRKSIQSDYERVAEWMRTGTIKVVIEHVYEMKDVKATFARLKSGRVRGKLVLKVS